MKSPVFLLVLLVGLNAPTFQLSGDEPKPKKPLIALSKIRGVDFVKDVKPVLEVHCLRCHHGKSQFTTLKFHTRKQILDATTKERPILIPGNARNSSFYLVTALPKYFVEAMPAGAHQLTEKEKDIIYRWINHGAKWPDNVVLDVAPGIEIIKSGAL